VHRWYPTILTTSRVRRIVSAATEVLANMVAPGGSFVWHSGRIDGCAAGTSIGSVSCRDASAFNRLSGLERARDLPCFTRITHQIENLLAPRGISPSCQSVHHAIKEAGAAFLSRLHKNARNTDYCVSVATRSPRKNCKPRMLTAAVAGPEEDCIRLINRLHTSGLSCHRGLKHRC
jgi:hypothetical protein